MTADLRAGIEALAERIEIAMTDDGHRSPRTDETRYLAHVAAREAILAAHPVQDAPDARVETVARVLREHASRPAGSPHCVCGWRPAMYLNDTESDRGQHQWHQAAVAVAALGDAGGTP